jgi:hypothetical protein
MPPIKDNEAINVNLKMRQSDVLDIAKALGYTGSDTDAVAIVAYLKEWVARIVGEKTVDYRRQKLTSAASESVMQYQTQVMSELPSVVAPDIE